MSAGEQTPTAAAPAGSDGNRTGSDGNRTGLRPVHIVVVGFHGASALRACLAPLTPHFAVTVVDNSSDPQVRAVALDTGAEYRDPGRNGGFSAGVNTALRELLPGPERDILLLNPDAVIQPEGVFELSAALHASDERTGTLTPALRTMDGRPQRAMWPFPSPGRAWLEAVGLGRLNRAEDFAVGTALLLRWEAVVDVGLFDEGFFLYAEETDWQRRAHDRGWCSALATSVVVRHVGGGTSADPLRREVLFHAGTETYLRKWFGRRGWALYRAAVLAGAVPRAMLLPARRREAAVYRRNLYRRGPRRVAGLEAT